MRRPWWARLAAAALGLWLALVLGEPGLVHVCPTHDGVPGGMAHGMAPGMAHAAAHHGDHAPAHQHQGCTCIGCCVGVAAIALIGRAPTIAPAVVRLPDASPRPLVALLPRPGPAHERPYATGPPRA